MDLLLSQAIDVLTTPSDIFLGAGLLALALLAIGRRRAGLWLAALCIVFFVMAGWTPVGTLALGALENRYPVPDLPEAPTGIIMLGGATDIPVSFVHSVLAFNDAGERLTVTAALARQYPDARIVLSGGPGHIARNETMTESSIARDLLVSLGIAPERILTEDHSRTTYENAVNSAVLIAPKAGQRWMLITSAFHMPRAVATFEGAGFSVIPYPVDFRTVGTSLPDSIPMGIESLDLAFHEWLGQMTYRLSGRAPATASGS